MNTDEMIDELLECTNLSDWELEFIDDLDKLRRKAGYTGDRDGVCEYTERQEDKVREIYRNRVEG